MRGRSSRLMWLFEPWERWLTTSRGSRWNGWMWRHLRPVGSKVWILNSSGWKCHIYIICKLISYIWVNEWPSLNRRSVEEERMIVVAAACGLQSSFDRSAQRRTCVPAKPLIFFFTNNQLLLVLHWALVVSLLLVEPLPSSSFFSLLISNACPLLSSDERWLFGSSSRYQLPLSLILLFFADFIRVNIIVSLVPEFCITNFF